MTIRVQFDVTGMWEGRDTITRDIEICPRAGELVRFDDGTEIEVKSVTHTPFGGDTVDVLIVMDV